MQEAQEHALTIDEALLDQGRRTALKVLEEELPEVVRRTQAGVAPFADGAILQHMVEGYTAVFRPSPWLWEYWRCEENLEVHLNLT